MLSKLIVLSASLLLAIPASAAGILSFTLDQSVMQTPPGGIFDPTCQNFATLNCVIFTGHLSFPTDQDYFVTDIEVIMSPANLDGGADVVGNDNYFQANVPGTFGPDGITSGNYSGGLFEVDVDPRTPTGIYNGMALEVTDSNNGSIILQQSFQVDVVPEPAVFTLGLAGLASLAAMGRRYRRK
jgi:hypothetical protein